MEASAKTLDWLRSGALTRRGFLKGAGLLSLSGATGFLVPEGVRAEMKPVQRAGSTMLKVSVNAFSFSRMLNAKVKHGKEGMDLFDLVDFCAKHNVDGMDATGFSSRVFQRFHRTTTSTT